MMLHEVARALEKSPAARQENRTALSVKRKNSAKSILGGPQLASQAAWVEIRKIRMVLSNLGYRAQQVARGGGAWQRSYTEIPHGGLLAMDFV
jgi:hypothetical protein